MRLSRFFNSFHQAGMNPNIESSQTDWPEPEKLKNVLLPVLPLHINNTPEPYREWISDTATRMQCPIDFVAVTAIVATAAIIGTSCGIRPKQMDDWLVVPNLWGGLIGRPGMLKTPAVSEVIQLIKQLETEARKTFTAENSKYLANIELHKVEKEAIKSVLMSANKQALKNKSNSSLDTMSLQDQFTQSRDPDQPIWRRYKTNDATVEKLSELLAENPRGLLLYRDELMGLLASWEKDGRESDRAFFLEAWNGIFVE